MLKLLLLFILFIAVNGYTQTLIMNEVSQGEMGNMEYVEFVVIDTTVIYDCSSGVPPSIDIRGWIFDDNNGYHGPNGIAIGAIRFSFDPMWSTVPLGTIILIYNDADPNPEVPVIDVSMSDGNCQIVAPISDADLFESNATTPGAVACSYPAAGWVPGGNWSNTVLRNGGDCARIVDLAGCEVFSVCWGDVNLNTLIYFGGSATNTVYYFNNIDPNNQLNWSSGCADLPNCGTQDQTPGAPNNAANALYIASFNNSCTPIPPIVASAVVDNDELCSCDGQATASAVGSIPGYSYQWYDNSFVAIGQTSATATGLCPGTYNVIVTSSINCSDTATVTIVAGVPLNVTAINSGASCVGDTVVMNETGGDAISWSWASNGSASIINPSDQSPMVIGAVNGELFTVIITNVFGCTDSAQTTLTVNSLPVVSSFNSGPYCFGDAMDVSESGGAAISWLWTSNGAATITNDTDQNPVVTGVVDGEIFTVTGTGSNGCVNTAQTTIIVNAQPTVIAINSGPYCVGDLVDISETGGLATGWLWTSNGAATITNTTDQNPIITGAVDGEIFTVTGTDANGCANISQTIVFINALPTVSATNTGPYCIGDAMNASETGGQATSWLWTSNGSATITNDTDQNPTITGAVDGEIFTVTGTDSNGCPNTSQTVVVVEAIPTINVSNTGPYCFGDAMDVSESGGSAINWLWTSNGAATISNDTDQNPVVTGVVDGEIFTVTGTDANGCSNAGTTTLAVNNPVLLDHPADVEECNTYSLPVITGGDLTGNQAYYDNSQTNFGAVINGPITSSQTVWVYDGSGSCADEISFYVTINDCEIVVPTAFTPDSDQYNDDWEILGLDQAHSSNKVFVYNRWGSLLFESPQGAYDSNRWDGTYNGRKLPVGSYYYIIEFNDDVTSALSGTVSIILNN